jgi:glycosyltransferase involved in cell wall biosynthesis
VPAGAGVLVAPDDPIALAGALRRIIADPDQRRRMAASARQAAQKLPSWQTCAKLFAGALEAVA